MRIGHSRGPVLAGRILHTSIRVEMSTLKFQQEKFQKTKHTEQKAFEPRLKLSVFSQASIVAHALVTYRRASLNSNKFVGGLGTLFY